MRAPAFHLRIRFAVPTALQRQEFHSVTRARLRRSAILYAAIATAGALISLTATDPKVAAGGLGLVAPGAGFLLWAGPGADQAMAIALAVGSVLLFLAALVAWFGTGNVLLPPLAWCLSAVGAAIAGPGILDQEIVWPQAPWAVPMTLAFSFVGAAVLARRRRRRPERAVPAWAPPAATARRDPPTELSLEDCQRIRLLLDRALQPVDSFEGFEWRDQFQTAAVRYQLNFLSYALSSLQSACLPAVQAYFLEAQRRLLAKQSDPRVWRYWRLESLWGHLRWDPNPVVRDNIMYSGFVAAQAALADRASGGRLLADAPALDLRTAGGGRCTYRQEKLVACLAGQYAAAPFGLLACEPNWIYPLCNAITATALRAHDAQHGSSHWQGLAPRFRRGLEQEFTNADGTLVPFRSSLTGLAPPALGGAVMQAFPCYFLNALFPDLAAAHWARFRAALAHRSWRRAFWRVDVGNYGFSYASSLAASAAAATEMGDGETAARLLDYLAEACPEVLIHGVRHRRRASLWAHALEVIARHGGAEGLRAAASAGPPVAGPFVEEAPYPAVLVAAARADGRSIAVALYPGGPSGRFALGIAGLMPERHYRLAGRGGIWRADREGRLSLTVPVAGRTELQLVPVV